MLSGVISGQGGNVKDIWAICQPPPSVTDVGKRQLINLDADSDHFQLDSPKVWLAKMSSNTAKVTFVKQHSSKRQLGYKTFLAWLRNRNIADFHENEVPEAILETDDPQLLEKWLICFILEVGKVNGNEYPSKYYYFSGILEKARLLFMMLEPRLLRVNPAHASIPCTLRDLDRISQALYLCYIECMLRKVVQNSF